MKTKLKGKILAILMSLAMAFTMMPMMSQTAYADNDPVYTVTLNPGKGSGDPIVFKSDVNWYESTSDNGSDVPAGNFYRYLGNGKIWFRFPDYIVPDTFTAPDNYVFDKWTPGDMSPRGHYPISGDVTFTAQWKKDLSLLPESSYSLSPTSYTITQAGYTDIECVVTSFEKGKIESNGQQIEVDAIQFTLNKGTLTDGNGNSIPFLVDAIWHFEPSDSASINRIRASNESFTAAVFINENDFNAATPGTYTGTYQIDSTWIGVNSDEEFISGDPHYIALTLIVPDPSKSHTVTYEVVNGTWSNDETDPIEEVVVEGEKPSGVPTGMKPSEGYEGGSWSPDPTTTSITGDTKFTYTFTKKPTQPVKISAPTGKTLTYNGKSQTGVTAGEGYTLSGTTSATNAGSYQATATLKEGYVWSDGKTEPKTIPWKINKATAKVTVPKGKTFTYNGKAKTGVAAGANYTLSGTVKATKVGTFTAKATLKTNANYIYKWSDGTTAAKTIKWTINKAANPLTIKAKTATVKGSTKGKNGKLKKTKTLAVSKVIAFTKKGQGKITYTKASGNKKITINKKTGKVTVKKGLKKGAYKVKVKVKAAGNANYKASAVKTVTFKVKVK